MKEFLVLSLGAIVGTNLRYFLTRLTSKQFGSAFPCGTLFINVAGSLIAGFFVIWATQRALADPRWRLLVVVGFCGSFTTFSAFAFDSATLFAQGRWLLAAANILGNNLLCLGAAMAGMALARVL